MAISNWFVKTKQIKKKSKGLTNHFNYLFNKNRDCHFYTEITDLNNSPDKVMNIINEVDQRQEQRRSEGLRGGGVRNYATSFVLSLPRDIQQPQSKKEWQRIAKISLQEMADGIGIPFEKIQKNAVVVLHDESNSSNKKNHIHILVGNVIDGQVVKQISQLQATHSLKQGFNKAVKAVLKEDNKLYIPKNENVGDKPLHVARAEQAQEKIDELNKKEEKVFNAEIDLDLKIDKFAEEKTKFYKAVKFARSVLSKWIKSVRTNQKNELEKRAKQSAKVIVDMKKELPEVSEELQEVAKIEEGKAELLKELEDDAKVSYQVVKEEEKQKKRKRRTRSRPG